MKTAFLGAFIAATVLVEIWANLNPIRTRLGLPELSSAALYGQPSRSAENQHPANDQGNAEIRPPSAAADPSSNPARRDADDGKNLDWPAWIQAASAVVTGYATILLVRITGRQAGLTERQVEISELQASIMDRQTDLTVGVQRALMVNQGAKSTAAKDKRSGKGVWGFVVGWENKGPTIALDCQMLTIVSLVDQKKRAFLYSRVEYDDLFESTKRRHSEVCVEIQLVADPNLPSDRYFDYRVRGPQNSMS